MPCKQRLSYPILLVTIAAMAATGCAGMRAGSRAAHPVTPEPPPAVDQRPVSQAVADSSAASAEIDEAIHGARTFFELGRQRYQAGQMAEARTNFDKAIERLTSFPDGARGDTRLADAYADILSVIQELETASYQTGNGLGPVSELPPIEDLDEIVPEISPEHAAQERALVETAEITTDPPIVFNNKVLAWLDLYQGRLHDRFQEGLTRSGRYIEMIRRIFREEGLPEDLCYMAHVESAYKPNAYSRARAKGVWQFIVGTGTRYGLRRDWWIDERSDPEMATRAAAAYLKDLYAMFGDWYLAMAAYNAGEGKVMRGMERTGMRDFWSLAQTSQLRLETKNYVPAILAAIVISKNPEKFGFTTVKEPKVVYDTVAIDSPTDLRVVSRLSGASVEDLRFLNPALARLQTPPGYADFEIRLPLGTGERFAAEFANLDRSERIPWRSHKVSKGETLASLSRRYGVPVSRIREANGIMPKERLRSGQTLHIPTFVAPAAPGHGDISQVSTPAGTKGAAVGSKRIHKVRKGDTLSSIARRYRTTVSALQSWNRLSGSSKLRIGDRLYVYYGREDGAAPASRSLQSAKQTSSGQSPFLSEAASGRDGGSSGGSARAKSRATTYRVRRGDTLFKIARQLSTTVERICSLNKLSMAEPLLPGTLLTIER